MQIISHTPALFHWQFDIGTGPIEENCIPATGLEYGYQSMYSLLKNRLENFVNNVTHIRNNSPAFNNNLFYLNAHDRLLSFINYIYAPNADGAVPPRKEIASYTLRVINLFEMLADAFPPNHNPQTLINELRQIADYILKE